MAKSIHVRSRRDPVLVRLFRESGHSYEAGVAWLIDKLRDSFAQEPVPATPRRVTYRAGTLDQVDPTETPLPVTPLPRAGEQEDVGTAGSGRSCR